MNQQEMFGQAKWISGIHAEYSDVFIVRGSFLVSQAHKAVIRVLGLGFFHLYINGKRVGKDLFLPLNSEYEPRDHYPAQEKLTAFHTYVPEYDILPYLQDGKNDLVLHFGGGWYCGTPDVPYGTPKAIWQIFGEDENGLFAFYSSEQCRVHISFVKQYQFPYWEEHNYLMAVPEMLDAGYDDSSWPFVQEVVPPQTDYCFSDCPPDRVIRTIPACRVFQKGNCVTYDCGCNTSGFPLLRLTGVKGEKVTVRFSEELTPDGMPEERYIHGQRFMLVLDGEERNVSPLFTWFGFRYFSVEGDAEVLGVQVVHASVKQISSFRSDCALANWIHDTYINTQLSNLHTGIPSDCPQIERRGYTGDGQLTAHAAMTMLDMRLFYKKWMQDIADSQDSLSGHVQYTAPYVRSGGGPGGWGSAIVEVPWQYYRHYGDLTVLKTYYPSMLRYFEYLEAHSSRGLVISDKEGEWCLGDWCTPEKIMLPAPFVNNYFYIRALLRCVEIARLIGQETDIPLFQERIRQRKAALLDAYFNSFDGNFLGSRQGANAFMLDIGLGDERTYPNLVDYYRALGRFDTGIFGTELVTRILFEHGNGQLAADLLLSDSTVSYSALQRLGATTLWEYWPHTGEDRSHNHPMFGAAVACFYDYLMGVHTREGFTAYEQIEIAPVLVRQINELHASRELPAGTVSVSYQKSKESVSFVLDIPASLPSVFRFAQRETILSPGCNKITLKNSFLSDGD